MPFLQDLDWICRHTLDFGNDCLFIECGAYADKQMVKYVNIAQKMSFFHELVEEKRFCSIIKETIKVENSKYFGSIENSTRKYN